MAWQPQGQDENGTPYWFDPVSLQYTSTDPNPTLGGLLGYGAPVTTSGGAEGGTDITTTPLSTIAGTPVGQYQVRQVADKMYGTGEVGPAWEAMNPKTGQWEPAWRVPWSVAGNNMTFVPMSIAQQIPGSVPLSDMASGKTAGHLEDNLQGLSALAVGVGGPLAGGAITGALGGAGAGLAGATTADIAGLTGASGAVGGGGTLATLAGTGGGLEFAGGPELFSGGSTLGGAAGGTAGMGPMGLDSYAATGGVGAGTSWTAGGAAAGAGGTAITDAGTGTFGSPGADATAAQATSGGTIGSGGYDAATAAAAGAGAAGTGITGSTAASGASALSKILSGNGTAADYASLAGNALPGILGAVGASQQSGALSDLANQYLGFGAPSRARYEASMTPGFDPTTIPGYAGALDSSSKAILSRLSATGGNPYGNPGALIEANKQIVNGTALPAVQNYQNQNAASGGISQLAGAVPGIAQQAIGSGSGVYSALGSAASSAFNPPQTVADLLKLYGVQGGAGGGYSPTSGGSSPSLA